MIKRFVIIQLLAITLVGFSGCETVTGSLNSIESKAIEDNRSQLSNRLAQDGWDVDTLDTARDVDYLNESEKDVILASNSVRTNPAHFGELYVKPVTGTFDGFLMIESNDVRIQTQEGVAAVNELYNQLLRMDNMGMYLPSEGLSRAAADHALDQSRTGDLGHSGSDGSQPFERINRYGEWQVSAGENISYGNDDGLGIILQLLIDDGVPSRGHRKNILNPDFNLTGVGIDKHPQYGDVCVIDYATEYNETL